MKKVTREDVRRLQEAGWQSWSFKWLIGDMFKFPRLNYPPSDYGDFSHLNLEYEGVLKEPVRGWCSWFAYGGRVSEKNVLEHARWFRDNSYLDIEYLLVDGGWCRMGDWLSEDIKKFPKGLVSTVNVLSDLRFKAGVWISPFQASSNTKVFKNHPEWFTRDKKGFVDGLLAYPVDKFLKHRFYLLDITREDAWGYLISSIDRLLGELKFKLIKLDFLYSLYFHPNLSSKEADLLLQKFLRYIKEKYPDVYTIGCGAPLVPCIGLVDSMRVGPDSLLTPFVNFNSRFRFADIFIHKRAIETVKSRLWSRKLWNLDLDSFACRGSIGLTSKMLVDSIEMIKRSGGNIFLGDDMLKLSQNRINKYVKPLFDIIP